jgi:DNA-binding CsgD family transcriptional regulator
MAKSTARAEGRFKQLCCLGLGGEAVMPALLAELHAMVPSHGNVFHFADKAGKPAHVYNEHPDFPASIYTELFYERRDREIKGLAYSEASETEFGVNDANSALGPHVANIIRRSEIHDLITRPLGYDTNFLRMFIRDGKTKSTLGLVSLYPSTAARSWTPEDKRRLSRLEPYFAYALTMRTDTDELLTDSGDGGVIIANTVGQPVHFSTEGRRLLSLANHPRVAPGVVLGRVPALPEPVVRICRNLRHASSGDANASAPVYHHRNVWGGFRFRAEWLDGNDPTTGLIAIVISHQEPLSIRLTRDVERLLLTRRQAEVCVMMATGYSHEKIAERLGISKHTANEHGRWIYQKLDVHNRAELVGKLLSG